jgi:hypothetical protein
VIEQAALHQVDEVARYPGAQDMGTQQQNATAFLSARFTQAPAKDAERRVGEWWERRVQGQNRRQIEIVLPLAQRLNPQA